jgi:hypothetical protein
MAIFSLSLALRPPWDLASDFQFHDRFTGGRTPWTSEQFVARPLPNRGQHKHSICTYTYQTSMPCVELEPTIPASEQVKTVHALDRSAIVTGRQYPLLTRKQQQSVCIFSAVRAEML